MHARLLRSLTLILCFSLYGSTHAQSENPTALYMANEGLMVTDGDTKILFDPLFPESFGQYLLVPEEMNAASFGALKGSSPVSIS